MFALRGWRFTSEQPVARKYVMIVAPHTSNWDFFLMVVLAAGLGRQLRFMGKHSLFTGLQGRFLVWLGGVAVERSSHHDFVSQMVVLFKETEDMVLIIAPEGTRSKVQAWKGGFYHIAAGADLPVLAAQLDYAKKYVGIAPEYRLSGNYPYDIERIQAFYCDVTAKYPEQDSSCVKSL
ncbi:1-acyl-sn-glycerol-3-phosphate acyltransferase [Zhongshania sp.]|uniref:1-acyl-sn-glycerol-3-phosphate acyltransferase n=1 Tax=Zhongshania sp. TaxID=1971902 RepID=UPI001B7CBF95|nr:1-acyl-sn-glycerol-3-phosphate acyltransferase [Zhongshania sp.]MBQ0795136.1 1-acyl-sn-glycerol-3-phosphate acyltransferase [Zhongshania sp.]